MHRVVMESEGEKWNLNGAEVQVFLAVDFPDWVEVDGVIYKPTVQSVCPKWSDILLYGGRIPSVREEGGEVIIIANASKRRGRTPTKVGFYEAQKIG